ncbi:hypothetical protein HPB50_004975 [Hyalomma asiaticum]|uniref:Uncharacterized protein n=1 Tax=Hyalomma asiaticum TaxID=266040 RepID=A0ACB7TET8_HYAAI|nr:hypothetical protein HPB50_004975 [Hyalomma asiaticum]
MSMYRQYLAYRSQSLQTKIKNSSVGVQVSPLSVCDISAQTEDGPVYSGEIELGPLCSTPRHHVDTPDLHLYRTDFLSDKMSCSGDSDSDIIDCTNDSSYICDELNDDDSDLEPPVQEMCAEEGVCTKKYIVFETCLMELFKCCRVCGAPESAVDIATTGTMISATIKCTKNHVTKWCSQPVVQGKALGNVLLCCAILFTGSSRTKVIRLLSVMGVQSLQKTEYFQYQRCYLLAAVEQAWQSQQKSVIEEAKEQACSLAGDGRCDTPGHSADFGTYTLMDTDLNKIIHTELVKSTEVSSSNKMEKEGLERALNHLIEQGLCIDSLVTDRNSEIKAFMRNQHPAIRHLFDVWHIAKGLKKIIALGRLKRHESVIGWRKTIVRHLYWCAANSHGYEKLFLARWLSILRHVANVHNHPDPLHPSCIHGQIPERDWLIEGSESYQRLKTILATPHLLRDIPRASQKAQTSGLEAFHSLLIHFAPKSSKFTYEGTMAR